MLSFFNLVFSWQKNSSDNAEIDGKPTYKIGLYPYVSTSHHRHLLVIFSHHVLFAVAPRLPFCILTPCIMGINVGLQGNTAGAFRSGRTQVGSERGLGASGRIAAASCGVAVCEEGFKYRKASHYYC